MWYRKADITQIGDNLFRDLFDYILRANNQSDLNRDPIGKRLEDLAPLERTEVVDRVRNGRTPLFLAAERGLTKIVIYLLDKCNANIEKKGAYKVRGDHIIHYVTPLWRAAVAGQLEVCKVLVEKGANVNVAPDTGSTAVLSACYVSNSALVEYLVLKGADVNRANNSGSTCLINSVRSADLCDFLILKGANVNAQDSDSKTALHHAVQAHRLETVKVLLRHGANPKAKNKHGDDALQTACLEGCEKISNYLIDTKEYSSERVADAYELLGATFVDENHDIGKAIDYWKKAVEYREREGIGKDFSYPTHPVYMGLRPFKTMSEVEALAVNLDQLQVHSLMINERVLGKSRRDTIHRLMYRGAKLADRLAYEHCIELWKCVVDILLHEDSALHDDTCIAFENLVNALFDRAIDSIGRKQKVDWLSYLNDVLFLLEKCIDSFPKAIEQLKAVPTSRRHEENWDRLLKTLVHLIHLAAVVCRNCEDEDADLKLQSSLRRINRIAPTTVKGYSLLDLLTRKVDGSSRRGRQGFGERQSMFTDPIIIELLLKTGAAVETTNQTPRPCT